jgi:hypothetical protein
MRFATISTNAASTLKNERDACIPFPPLHHFISHQNIATNSLKNI